MEPIIGIDEVGLGSQAGPLLVASVTFWEGKMPEGLKDSKKLSAKKRESLSKIILETAREVRFAYALVHEINRKGIRQALTDTVEELCATSAQHFLPVHSLIKMDGEPLPFRPLSVYQIEYIVGGDNLIPEISAASIVAKVHRDALMVELGKMWPMYNWASNKGYLTREHLQAIVEYGVCPAHRKYITQERAKEILAKG